jgi:hypothetical protein
LLFFFLPYQGGPASCSQIVLGRSNQFSVCADNFLSYKILFAVWKVRPDGISKLLHFESSLSLFPTSVTIKFAPITEFFL